MVSCRDIEAVQLRKSLCSCIEKSKSSCKEKFREKAWRGGQKKNQPRLFYCYKWLKAPVRGHADAGK